MQKYKLLYTEERCKNASKGLDQGTLQCIRCISYLIKKEVKNIIRMGKRERNQKIAHNGRHPYIQKHKVIKVKLKLIVTTWQLRSCILINQYAVG